MSQFFQHGHPRGIAARIATTTTGFASIRHAPRLVVGSECHRWWHCNIRCPHLSSEFVANSTGPENNDCFLSLSTQIQGIFMFFALVSCISGEWGNKIILIIIPIFLSLRRPFPAPTTTVGDNVIFGETHGFDIVDVTRSLKKYTNFVVRITQVWARYFSRIYVWFAKVSCF